jgi:hypothetical protein
MHLLKTTWEIVENTAPPSLASLDIKLELWTTMLEVQSRFCAYGKQEMAPPLSFNALLDVKQECPTVRAPPFILIAPPNKSEHSLLVKFEWSIMRVPVFPTPVPSFWIAPPPLVAMLLMKLVNTQCRVPLWRIAPPKSLLAPEALPFCSVSECSTRAAPGLT